jgi:hypothetical protein
MTFIEESLIMAANVVMPESHKTMYLYIESRGKVDKYIDADEEQEIFNKAQDLGIWQGQAEAMLNHRCKQFGWTRESEVSRYLKVMLEEATKDDGEIDKKEFDHIIGFAVAVRMPRKDAIRICCEIVRQAGWKTASSGLLKKQNWFQDYESGG